MEMSKFKVHIHSKSFKTKPQGYEVGKISKEIINSEMELSTKELASLVGEQGHTVVLATMDGERKISSMIQQQVIMIDFDNTETLKLADGTNRKIKTDGFFYTSIEDVLANEYVQQKAAFIYKSFSHKEGWDKFRLVFVLDKALTSDSEVKQVYNHLFEKFPNADIACKDSSRLFFGGTEVTEINFNNLLTVDSIPMVVEAKPKAVKSKKTAPVTKKAPVTKVSGEKPTWQLIKEGKDEEVAKRLSKHGMTLHSKVQAINYFKTLDMAEVLGIQANPFNDLFHEETSPSSSIFKMENSEIYLYKCHSASHAFCGDIVQVVAKLQGVGYNSARDYLIKVCDMNIELTEQVIEIREQADLFINMLLSEELNETYPAIKERFGRYKTQIIALMEIMKENIYEDEDGNLRSLTWLSTRNLAKRIYGKEGRFQSVAQLLNLLVLTDWIDKLDDSQIPKALIAKFKATQNAMEREKRSNVFELLKQSGDFFTQLNLKCEEMKRQGFTMRGLSREYVIRTHGVAVADKIYPQDTKRTISKKSNAISTYITEMTMKEINENGYAVVNDIMAKAAKKFKTKGYTEFKFKQCVGELIDSYNLVRCRLNKQLKEQFNITKLPSTSAPVILMPAN